MNRDQLADYFKVGFDRLHEIIAAEPDAKLRKKAEKLANRMHAEANALLALGKSEGGVQPFSGGEPKPQP